MEFKLILLFTLCFLASHTLSAQNKQVPNAKDSILGARKTLQALILTLKKQDAELFTVFDSTNLKKIQYNYQPITNKFYSTYLLTYSPTKEDLFTNVTTQSIQFYNSILLYNNAQYLHYIPSSVIQIDFADKKEIDSFLQHPLGKYCKKALIISLKKGNEKREFYIVFFDEFDKIIVISPILHFGKDVETPLLDKAIESFIEWQSKAKTIFKFERQERK
jgi:hypothetical protein